MSAAYPPVGTRVRWTTRGKVREGVVVMLDGFIAATHHSALAFRFGEARQGRSAIGVVDVESVNGRQRTRNPRYYHPQAHWLEAVEPAGEER